MTTATVTGTTTPKAKAEPIVITAPKGGDRTVAPIKGKIAAAIKASGKTLNAISRDFGLNPSQLRRLSLDQVARVDLPRAEAIAKALGKPLSDLFGPASDKAKAKPAVPRAATTTAPKATGKAATRRSRAAKATG
jgi:lambda repressor-like predicted transcriptional regulator